MGVVKPGVSDADIAWLTECGIIAQRIFQLPWGAVGFDRMHDVMSRVHPAGWHANIQLDGRELPQWEDTIKKLPGKFVIDHVGKYLEPVTPEHEAFKPLLRLLDTGRCWVKLSAPYETSKTGAPKYEDVGRLAKGAGEARTRAHDVGEQLAASVSAQGQYSRRRRSARPVAGLGAG